MSSDATSAIAWSVATCMEAVNAQRKLSGMPPDPRSPSRYTVAAWILTGVALLLILLLHLLPALLAGMLVYELVHVIAPAMSRHFSNHRAKLVAVGLLSAVIVLVVSA